MRNSESSLINVKLLTQSLTDRFLHQSILENAELLQRARFLVIVLLLITPQHIALLLSVMTPALAASRSFTSPFAVGGCLMLTYLLAKLKWQGAFIACRNLFVIYGSFVVLIACMVTGGPMHSAAAQVLVIVAVMAFFLGGARYGLLVCSTLLSIIVLMIALQSSGVIFPQLTPDTIDTQDREIVLVVNFVFLVTMVFAYEAVNVSVREARDRQHLLYEELARTDTLTGLLNRRAFDQLVGKKIRDFARSNSNFALCYLDLNQFKPVNDQFGHDIGDDVLREIASRLTQLLGPGDFAARRGGDEFMVFFAGVDLKDISNSLAQRLHNALEQPIDTRVAKLQLGGSFGFALFPHHATTLPALTSLADHAMYDAKKRATHWSIAATN